MPISSFPKTSIFNIVSMLFWDRKSNGLEFKKIWIQVFLLEVTDCDLEQIFLLYGFMPYSFCKGSKKTALKIIAKLKKKMKHLW